MTTSTAKTCTVTKTQSLVSTVADSGESVETTVAGKVMMAAGESTTAVEDVVTSESSADSNDESVGRGSVELARLAR